MPHSYIAVEGDTDEAVARRLFSHCGLLPYTILGRLGKSHLLERLPNYNRNSYYFPWVIIVDLDQDAACASIFRANLVSQEGPFMCIRVAVRAVEAWLMADRVRCARLLQVSQSLIPSDVDGLADPKEQFVSLARRSRSRSVSAQLVPRPGSGRKVGPGYASAIIEFAERRWDPEIAAQASPSLARSLRSLGSFRDYLNGAGFS